MSYYLSLNHHEQEGIIAQSGLRREALRFNFDTRVKEWLKVGLQSNLGYSQYETNNETESSSIYSSSPSVLPDLHCLMIHLVFIHSTITATSSGEIELPIFFIVD